jgi:hypothetical protein
MGAGPTDGACSGRASALSLQPMASRLGLRGHDQLHHFVASTTWDDAPRRRLLIERADALVGGPNVVLVVDGTALPKQGGTRSAWRGSTAGPRASGRTARSWSRRP